MISINDFGRYSRILYRLSADFIRAVPDEKWEFSPGPRFGPFCKQVRHLVCARGVYNAALATLETVDVGATIDWDGTPFTFADFTWEFVQHEAIHHGQWSLYAALAGFDTPHSWRSSWGL